MRKNYLKECIERLKTKFVLYIRALNLNVFKEKEKPEPAVTGISKKKAEANRACRTQQLLDFLQTEYVFRYNSLTGVTEFRRRNEPEAPFYPMDHREMNGLIVEARLRGIECWIYDVPTLVLSTLTDTYHPFHLYMNELPGWDGVDRITPLAHLISEDTVWMNGFHRWMLGMAAQWIGQESAHANALAPILVSTEQGYNKSTFCKMLLPDSLQADYYLDKLNISTQTMPERKLTTCGLINLDEFDRIGENKIPELKNLMQMVSIHLYQGKMKGWCSKPRLASFIGTTNKKQILSDPTGSRRFLCVELKKAIPEISLEHKQLYAQLKQELQQGERSWLTKAEEQDVQQKNREFYIQSPMEEAFYACFRSPGHDEKGEWLTAVELYTRMQRRFKAAMRDSSPRKLCVKLVGIGWQPRHTRHGNRYHVVEIV